jgi:hypothetical protein
VYHLYLEVRSGSRRTALKDVNPIEVVAGPCRSRSACRRGIQQAITQLQSEKK